MAKHKLTVEFNNNYILEFTSDADTWFVETRSSGIEEKLSIVHSLDESGLVLQPIFSEIREMKESIKNITLYSALDDITFVEINTMSVPDTSKAVECRYRARPVMKLNEKTQKQYYEYKENLFFTLSK